MKTAIYILLALWAHAAFAENDGWTVGIGMVSNDIINADEDRPFFPNAAIHDKRYMLIPNLRYEWDNWSLGADGIGWKHAPEEGLSSHIQVGYPFSGAGVEGKVGWFQYGLSGGLNYSDGLIAEPDIQLGPVNYAVKVGIGDRSEDFSQQLSLGFPLYIASSEKVIIIGKGFVQQDNASYLQNDFELTTPITDANYIQKGLNALGIYKPTERLTILLSGTLQWNDKALKTEIETLPKVQFNIFTLFSYYLGK